MQPYSYEKINNICLIILASVATVAALIYTRIVLVPFVISVFFFAVLSPLIRYIEEKLKLPRVLAIVFVFFILGLITTVCWLFLFQSIKGFVFNLDVYKLKAIELVQELSITASNFGLKINPNMIQEEIQDLAIIEWARSISGGIAAFIGNSFLIFVFVVFLLVGEKNTPLPESNLFHYIRTNTSRYITIKFLSSIFTAIFVGILFYACQVELAFLFAFLTFFLNFIPNIGSVIASLLPLPIVVLSFGFGWQFVVVLGGQIFIHSLIGTMVEPKLLGERMGLHPIAILMFLIFWGLVWGIPGMFLAVPITSILRLVFSRIEATRSFSELLAGRIT